MTGAEHYREAERLLAAATLDSVHPDGSPVIRDEPETLAAAQVHMLGALTAAVIAGAVMRPEDRDEWDRIIGIAGPAAEVTR